MERVVSIEFGDGAGSGSSARLAPNRRMVSEDGQNDEDSIRIAPSNLSLSVRDRVHRRSAARSVAQRDIGCLSRVHVAGEVTCDRPQVIRDESGKPLGVESSDEAERVVVDDDSTISVEVGRQQGPKEAEQGDSGTRYRISRETQRYKLQSRVLQSAEEHQKLAPTTVDEESITSSTFSSTPEDSSDEDFAPIRKRKYSYVRRCRRAPSLETEGAKRRKIKLNSNRITTMRCCARLQCFRNADKPYLIAQARRLLEMKQHERKQVLQSMYDSTLEFFKFNGTRVCCVFLEEAFGFSRYLQATVKGTPASKKARESSSQDYARSATSQRDAVICYLERLAESTADKMPDRDELHLPFFLKDDVYNDFVREFGLLYPSGTAGSGPKRDAPSRSYFYSMWSKYCSKIKVRKKHRFTKCGDCERLRAALEKKRTNARETQLLKEKKRIHNEMVAKERREYAKKMQKATLYPQDFCSIIVDGADQSAFGLPHFRVSVKEARGHSIGVKLIGVLEHGSSNKVTLLLMTEQYATGANHIIEAIHRHLTQKALTSQLPKTLYLQFDNCQRENKNQFLFAYLECLVAWGVFCEVFASALPIGHTHADIDQVFSRTSTRLRYHDAVTMSDMMEQLSKSYTPQPHVIHMKGIANYSGLITNTKCVSAPTGFTAYRYFYFARSKRPSSANCDYYNTTCLVRAGCEDDWIPLRNESDSGFLKEVPDLSFTPPTTVTSPTNSAEVSKRLTSEETRIQSESLQSLRDLQAEVYRTGLEQFHWDLKESLEMNGRFRKTAASSGEETEEENISEQDPNMDLEYNVNEFVATRVNLEREKVPFWIGRIEEVVKNSKGVATELVLYWYELVRGRSAYKGKYEPSTIDGTRTGNPYITRVSVDTVICRFSNLTKKNEISVNDQKSIWQSLH